MEPARGGCFRSPLRQCGRPEKLLPCSCHLDPVFFVLKTSLGTGVTGWYSSFQELCATPRLFADDPQEGQVKQGLLGDCWLLCACAALQKSQRLLEQVPASRGARCCLPGRCAQEGSGRQGSRASCSVGSAVVSPRGCWGGRALLSATGSQGTDTTSPSPRGSPCFSALLCPPGPSEGCTDEQAAQGRKALGLE